MTRRITVATASGTLVILAAAAILAWNAIATSSARVADSTSTESFFTAGEVRLEQAGSRVDFLFDDDGLYPGRVLTGCVDFVYEGNVPASVRLHGRSGKSAELDDYLRVDIHLVEDCETEPTLTPRFSGTLSQLWVEHPDFARGVIVASEADAGTRFAVRADIEVVDDNAAQGLRSSFVLTAEARP